MKLLLESWRKFLKEEEPPSRVKSKMAAAGAALTFISHDGKPQVPILPIADTDCTSAKFAQKRPDSKAGSHQGLDQVVAIGTPVRAIADGVVISVVPISTWMGRTNRILRTFKLPRQKEDIEGWYKAKQTLRRAKRRWHWCNRKKKTNCGPELSTKTIRNLGGSSWRPGTYVTIEHTLSNNKKIRSQYMHLSEISVASGKIKQGDIIGRVGDTAVMDDCEHLHFVIWHRGRRVNPANFIEFKSTKCSYGGRNCPPGPNKR